MKRIIITLVSIILVVLAFGQTTYKNNGAVRLAPRLMNYQGYLTDTLGNPITNPSVSMTFGVWSASSGGTQVWFETQTINVTKGIFNVLLGNLTPIPDSVFTKSTDRWLELTYAGITLSPRTRIAATGYALSATYADTAYSVVNNAITTPKILDTAVTMAKIARTGATTNQVIKWNGSMWQPSTDVASSDTDWIFSGNNIYSGVSGGVGIGTTSPWCQLHVYKNSNTGSANDNAVTSIQSVYRNSALYLDGSTSYSGNIVFCGNGTEQGRIAYNNTGNYLAFNTNNSEKARIDAGGNVGIGTTSPGALFTVSSTGANYGNGIRMVNGANYWESVHDLLGGLTFGYNGADRFVINRSGNSYFTSGRVGILTANPAAAFAVSTGDDRKQFVINPYVDQYTCSIGIPDWYYVGQLVFVNGSERMRIDNNGNVGIGTVIPVAKLDVAGNARITDSLSLTALNIRLTSDTSDWVYGNNIYATNDGTGRVTGIESYAGGSGFGDKLGVNSSAYAPTGSSNMVTAVYGHCENRGSGVTYGGDFWAPGWGTGATYGVRGQASSPAASTADAYGAYGHGGSTGAGRAYGGYFSSEGAGSGNKYGIYSTVTGSGTLWAGYFFGNVNVTGSLSKGSGSFLIDHPLDPQNKTLRHNFVESPENLCLYRGKIKLNSSGEGRVEMPDYFKALTKETEATVTLTSIGRPFNTGYDWNKDCSVFAVYGEPDREVSYVVMADRDDPVMRQLYKPVEEEKGNGNFTKGKLLYPKAYGYPEEMGENYAIQHDAAARADAGK
jgi:hypothetical protein